MKILKLFNIVLIVMIVGVSFFGYYMTPNFIKMYDSMLHESINIKQFFTTQLIISSYKYWIVTLVIPIIVYVKFLYKKVVIKKSTKVWLFLMFFLLFLALLLMIPFITTSLYLPIMEMADIIDEAEKTGQ